MRLYQICATVDKSMQWGSQTAGQAGLPCPSLDLSAHVGGTLHQYNKFCATFQLSICTEQDASTSFPTRKIILQNQGKWWCVPWAASNHRHAGPRSQTPASLARHRKVEKWPWPESSIALEHPQKYVIVWQRIKILLGPCVFWNLWMGENGLDFPGLLTLFLEEWLIFSEEFFTSWYPCLPVPTTPAFFTS